MPRQKSLITVIRELVRKEIADTIQSLLGGVTGARTRKRRKRRGPGRPTGSKTRRRRARRAAPAAG